MKLVAVPIAVALAAGAAQAGPGGVGLLVESSVMARTTSSSLAGTGESIGLVWAPKSPGAWVQFAFNDLPLPSFSEYGLTPTANGSSRMNLRRRDMRRLKDFSAGVIFRMPEPGARPFVRIGTGWFHDDGADNENGPRTARTGDGNILSVNPNDWGPGASLGLGIDGGARSPAAPVIEIRGQTTRFYDITHNLFLSFHAGIWFR